VLEGFEYERGVDIELSRMKRMKYQHQRGSVLERTGGASRPLSSFKWCVEPG